MFKIEKRLRKIAINDRKPEMFTVSKRNKTLLDAAEIKQLAYTYANQFELKHKRKHSRVIIRGIGDLGVTTIKSGDTPIRYMFDSSDDYCRDKVTFEHDFMEFYQIEITIY